MKTFDIKSAMPTRSEARDELLRIIRSNRQEKVIKIIHGYGSSGVGGTIRDMTRDELQKSRSQGQIATFIPGEATVKLMGFDDEIRKYKHLLATDSDFKKGNDGITYVIFSV